MRHGGSAITAFLISVEGLILCCFAVEVVENNYGHVLA